MSMRTLRRVPRRIGHGLSPRDDRTTPGARHERFVTVAPCRRRSGGFGILFSVVGDQDHDQGTEMADAWIIDACRTPRGIGKPGKGALADIHPQQLARHGAGGASSSATTSTPPTSTTSSGAPARRWASRAATSVGWPRSTPATTSRASGVTLDRFCGSGITANNFAAAVGHGRPWRTSSSAAATEMMSSTRRRRAEPVAVHGRAATRTSASSTRSRTRACAPTRSPSLEGIAAPGARRAARPSRSARAAVAIKEGRFDRSLVPVLNLDGTLALDHEEFPRPGTTAESLAALPPAFAAVADYRSTRRAPRSASMVNAALPRPRDRARAPRRQLLGRGRRRGRRALSRARTTPRRTA